MTTRDIHSTSLWNKFISPVLQCAHKVGITISPPAGMGEETAYNIVTLVTKWVSIHGLKSYFVLEQDKNKRWHWHGTLGFTRERAEYKPELCNQLKDQLKEYSYVDFQYRIRSLNDWICYTLKDQTYFMNQTTSHHRLGRFPRIPKIELHVVSDDYNFSVDDLCPDNDTGMIPCDGDTDTIDIPDSLPFP